MHIGSYQNLPLNYILLFFNESRVISGTGGPGGEGEVLTADSEGGARPRILLPLQQAGQLGPPAGPAGVS